MSVIGSMEIALYADLARLRRDMGGAVNIARNASRNIEQTLSRLGVGLSAGGIGLWVKSVIDAGGAAVDMAQKVGMSVEDLTSLQLAFQQSGVQAEAFKGGIVQMSKSVADNAGAYKALGIATEEANGQSREAKEVLMDLANVFKALPDGLLKTKLATELLGKSGADMIPALNQGGAAMRASMEDARALGGAMSTDAAKAADEFGDSLDVLRAQAQTATLNGMSEMLPVLTMLAKQFSEMGRETQGSGEKFSFWREAFAVAAETISVLTLEVVYAFRLVGKEIGVIAAQIVQFAQGNFAAARAIGAEWREEAAQLRAEVDRQTSAVLGARDKQRQLNEAMRAGQEAAALSAGEARRLGLDTTSAATAMAKAAIAAKELEAAKKKAAEEAKRLAEAQQRLREAGAAQVQQITDEVAAQRMALAMGRALTDAERDYLKIAIQVRDGKVLLTDAQLKAAWATLQARDATKALEVAEAERLKTMAAVAAHSGKLALDEAAHTDSLRESVLQLRQQNERMRIGDEAFTQREAKLIREQAAELEWQASMQGGNFQLQEQARLLRERATLMEEGVAVKEAKAVAAEWKKTSQEIASGMADALMQGFESGKSAWVVLRNYLINSAKTMVLRPMLEMAFSPLAQQMSPWLSAFRAVMGGVGGAGGGGNTNPGIDIEGINQLGKPSGAGLGSSSGGLGKSGQASTGGTLSLSRGTASPRARSGEGASVVYLTQNVTVNVDAAADQARMARIARDATVQGNRELTKELKAMGVLGSS